MTKFNADQTRAINDDPACGVACYEGTVTEGQFNGSHRGACRDWDDAEMWLAGGVPASLIQIYPADTKHGA